MTLYGGAATLIGISGSDWALALWSLMIAVVGVSFWNRRSSPAEVTQQAEEIHAEERRRNRRYVNELKRRATQEEGRRVAEERVKSDLRQSGASKTPLEAEEDRWADFLLGDGSRFMPEPEIELDAIGEVLDRVANTTPEEWQGWYLEVTGEPWSFRCPYPHPSVLEFDSFSEMERHARSHEFSCPHCRSRPTGREALIRHLEDDHKQHS